MTLLAPSKPPDIDLPKDLFREAKQRRRRRWISFAVATMLVLGGAIAGVAAGSGHHGTTSSASSSNPSPRGLKPLGSPKHTTEIAWIDYSGGLRIGDPGLGTAHLVARTSADPTTRLVQIEGRVYFIESSERGRSYLASFDTAAGHLESLGPAVNV